MRRSQLALVLVLLFAILPASLSAQQSVSVAPITPQRDPQAVAILQKAIVAAGGSQVVHAISDFIAQGQIKYPNLPNEPAGQVKIQGRGTDQVRMDIQMPEGPRSFVVDHGVGSSKNLGITTKISAVNGFQFGLVVFPLPTVLATITDPQADIILESSAEINGVAVYKIKTARSAPVGLERAPNIRNLRTSEIFIDSTTFMVVAVRHIYYPRETLRIGLVREVLFADYRQLGGVMFPFSVSESLGGQQTWNIALSGVSFNTGLADVTFH